MPKLTQNRPKCKELKVSDSQKKTLGVNFLDFGLGKTVLDKMPTEKRGQKENINWTSPN